MAESGLKGYAVESWFGLFAPAGTPPDIVTWLNAETAIPMRAPKMRERLAAECADPLLGGAAELTALLNEGRDCKVGAGRAAGGNNARVSPARYRYPCYPFTLTNFCRHRIRTGLGTFG